MPPLKTRDDLVQRFARLGGVALGEFREESLSHELAIVGVLTAVILGAAPEDADSGLALFVDIVHDDGYLEALPVFSLSLLK